MQRTLAMSTALVLLLLVFLTSTARHNAQAQTTARCFAETNLCIEGRIREFWEQNGGLAVFGYPITPQIIEDIEGIPRPVQWFERNRLELHPGSPRPYDVLLGRLGVDVLEQQGRDWFAFPQSAPQPDCRYFAETSQNICEPFLSVWRANGLRLDGQASNSEDQSLGLFGLPISPVQTERLSDGQEYQVQWFERTRFEYHPENPPEFQVLLGLLGNEARAGSSAGNSGTRNRIAFTAVNNNNQDVYVCTVVADQSGCTSRTRLTNIPQNDGQPVWSPDGSQVAFESDLDGDWEIYTISANGSAQSRLTENTSVDGAPSWAALAIGWRIAFHSDRDGGNFDIYLVDSGNAANIVRLTSDPAQDRYPAISPDGRRLAFASTRGGAGMHIYVADLIIEGDSVTLAGVTSLTETLGGESRKPAWSPDSSRLVFENTQGNNTDIYVVDTSGSSEPQNLTAHAAIDGHPVWSPDGTKIAFHSNREGTIFRIYVMNNDGSNPVRFISLDASDTIHPAWK